MIDPASLEVFRHRLAAVAEAMGAGLQRAAYSPNIKERLDFSCAVFDRDGRLLAQAAHIPVHLGAMEAAVAAARRRAANWEPGDVVALNDPYEGGSHLPDITTVSPVFVPSVAAPVLYVATRAHHADVGGSMPGSLPLARELVEEGLIIPPIRLVRGGQVDEDLLSMVSANSRTPQERRGDLEAQLAAHHVGTRRLVELAGSDPSGFARFADALLEYTERLCRSRLAQLGDGSYSSTDTLDGDGMGAGPIALKVKVTLDSGSLTADFTGSDRQTTGAMNAPEAVTSSAVYYVVACLVGDIPINSGTFAPIQVIAPRGTVLNPIPPAAVSAGNVETSQRIVDVVLKSLASAAPAIVPAASQGTMNNTMVGGTDPRTNKPFSYYETLGGGAGAGPTGDGASGIQVHMTNTRNTPVEALETAYPIRVLEYALRTGSGGAGRHRGGDGLIRRLQFLGPARVTLIAERRHSRPWGLSGGEPGLTGENTLTRDGTETPVPDKTTFEAETGSVLNIRTPGGGGWGKREER